MNIVSTTTWTIMMCVYLCFLCGTSTAEYPYRNISVRNNCHFPVWPAVADDGDTLPKPQGYKPLLNPQEFSSILFDRPWQGSIWGRVGCNFNTSSGEGHCDSGDCAGKMICEKPPADLKSAPVVTQVIIKPMSFAVTLAGGYNLPLSFVTSSPIENCGLQECTARIAVVCPKHLQVRNGKGNVIACNGSCDNNTCSPPEFESAFRKACPNAMPFTRPNLCGVADYFILTFCPTPSDDMDFHQK